MNWINKPKILQFILNNVRKTTQLLRETRSLILFWHLFIMNFFIGLSVPLFSELVLQEIRYRAQKEIAEKGKAFEKHLDEYNFEHRIAKPTDVQKFFTDILSAQIPDDDVFLIAIVSGEFYGSSPRALPDVIGLNSTIMKTWISLEQEEKGKYPTNSSIGDIIYLAKPVINENKVKGVFIVAHITAGEIQEAKIFIWIVVKVLLAVLIIALILTWLASGKILSPLRSLISTAKIISDANLAQRLPVQGTGEMAELANTFNEMMDRLTRAFTTQRAFINDAGHELRTPITIIRGHLELLEDDPLERAETLFLVFDELERMSRMVEDLLLLAKSEQPDFLQIDAINISIFVQEIISKSYTLASRHWRSQSLAKGIIKGDRHRLTQAIMNLIKNAIEHTQENDLIEIGSHTQGNYLYLWVRDTGEGIIESEQQRIFERFARVEKQARRSDGFGLGLSIVKVITEAHKGRVELISRVGIGSTFTLVIPKTGVR